MFINPQIAFGWGMVAGIVLLSCVTLIVFMVNNLKNNGGNKDD